MDEGNCIRAATPMDALDLAPRLGEGDALECYAYGVTPESALVDCVIGAEEAWAAIVHGRVEVIFGVGKQTELGDTHLAFLLASADVPKVRFLKEAQAVVDDWRGRYGRLRAYVDQRNTRALRWLGRLGFSVGGAIPVGPNGRPFLTVWLHKPLMEPYREVA